MGIGCRLCPRACGADRTGSAGFCGASSDLEVASVCLHRGEEPPLNPIVNLFFAHCNLQCIYCQNWQISSPSSHLPSTTSVNQLAHQITSLITHHSPLTAPLIGFVTAAHYAHRIPEIVEAVRSKLSTAHCPLPAFVYNSSGYESVHTLRSLEGLVDIYLPDFKYMDPQLAARYSHAPDYPEVAAAALQEMIRQVGIGLKVDDNGTAYRGLIVRHLVLPGALANSLQVLDKLSSFNSQFSTFNSLHLSLMAQYYPPRPDLPSPLDRSLSPNEYATVVDRYNHLGFNGWIQDLQSQNNYRPDFSNPNPFENPSQYPLTTQ